MSSRGPTTADPLAGVGKHVARVVTPEAALLEFRLAGIGSRFLAKMMDLLVQIMILLAVGSFGITVAGKVSETLAIVLYLLLFFAVTLLYPMMEASGGTTVGKRTFNIKVIAADGSPVGLRRTAVRTVIWWPEAITSLGLAPLLTALFSNRGQRIGDMAAGTLVVYSESNRAQPIVLSMWVGRPALADQIDASLLSPTDYGFIREFLARADGFGPEARVVAAATLAEAVERRCRVPRPANYPPETYLVAVFQAARRKSWEDAPAPPPTGLPSAPPPGAFLTSPVAGRRR